MGVNSDHSISIAVEGCCHGELDAIYDRLLKHGEKSGRVVDLLVCCGDFQSIRNIADFHSLAVPQKYRALGSFFRYYSGEKRAPIPTIFVGGNHEASQALQELYYGGWVAPNIYYLGAAGVVNFNGVRIAGISGIYKSHDYPMGRFERPPYDHSSLRSVYHVRSLDVYRLKCLSSSRRLDLMLSHDWPQGVEQHGKSSP
jgi:lariat debranching enzyme